MAEHDRETSVVYRAVADFSQLFAQVELAKAALKSMKDEQRSANVSQSSQQLAQYKGLLNDINRANSSFSVPQGMRDALKLQQDLNRELAVTKQHYSEIGRLSASAPRISPVADAERVLGASRDSRGRFIPTRTGSASSPTVLDRLLHEETGAMSVSAALPGAEQLIQRLEQRKAQRSTGASQITAWERVKLAVGDLVHSDRGSIGGDESERLAARLADVQKQIELASARLARTQAAGVTGASSAGQIAKLQANLDLLNRSNAELTRRQQDAAAREQASASLQTSTPAATPSQPASRPTPRPSTNPASSVRRVPTAEEDAAYLEQLRQQDAVNEEANARQTAERLRQHKKQNAAADKIAAEYAERDPSSFRDRPAAPAPGTISDTYGHEKKVLNTLGKDVEHHYSRADYTAPNGQTYSMARDHVPDDPNSVRPLHFSKIDIGHNLDGPVAHPDEHRGFSDARLTTTSMDNPWDENGNKDYSRATIGEIGVRKELQRQGIGSAMLEFARRESAVPIDHSQELTQDGKTFAAADKRIPTASAIKQAEAAPKQVADDLQARIDAQYKRINDQIYKAAELKQAAEDLKGKKGVNDARSLAQAAQNDIPKMKAELAKLHGEQYPAGSPEREMMDLFAKDGDVTGFSNAHFNVGDTQKEFERVRARNATSIARIDKNLKAGDVSPENAKFLEETKAQYQADEAKAKKAYDDAVKAREAAAKYAQRTIGTVPKTQAQLDDEFARANENFETSGKGLFEQQRTNAERQGHNEYSTPKQPWRGDAVRARDEAALAKMQADHAQAARYATIAGAEQEMAKQGRMEVLPAGPVTSQMVRDQMLPAQNGEVQASDQAKEVDAAAVARMKSQEAERRKAAAAEKKAAAAAKAEQDRLAKLLEDKGKTDPIEVAPGGEEARASAATLSKARGNSDGLTAAARKAEAKAENVQKAVKLDQAMQEKRDKLEDDVILRRRLLAAAQAKEDQAFEAMTAAGKRLGDKSPQSNLAIAASQDVKDVERQRALVEKRLNDFQRANNLPVELPPEDTIGADETYAGKAEKVTPAADVQKTIDKAEKTVKEQAKQVDEVEKTQKAVDEKASRIGPSYGHATRTNEWGELVRSAKADYTTPEGEVHPLTYEETKRGGNLVVGGVSAGEQRKHLSDADPNGPNRRWDSIEERTQGYPAGLSFSNFQTGEKGHVIDDVGVIPEMQRKGMASAMHSFAQRELGQEIAHSPNLTGDGAAFAAGAKAIPSEELQKKVDAAEASVADQAKQVDEVVKEQKVVEEKATKTTSRTRRTKEELEEAKRLKANKAFEAQVTDTPEIRAGIEEWQKAQGLADEAWKPMNELAKAGDYGSTSSPEAIKAHAKWRAAQDAADAKRDDFTDMQMKAKGITKPTVFDQLNMQKEAGVLLQRMGALDKEKPADAPKAIKEAQEAVKEDAKQVEDVVKAEKVIEEKAKKVTAHKRTPKAPKPTAEDLHVQGSEEGVEAFAQMVGAAPVEPPKELTAAQKQIEKEVAARVAKQAAISKVLDEQAAEVEKAVRQKDNGSNSFIAKELGISPAQAERVAQRLEQNEVLSPRARPNAARRVVPLPDAQDTLDTILDDAKKAAPSFDKAKIQELAAEIVDANGAKAAIADLETEVKGFEKLLETRSGAAKSFGDNLNSQLRKGSLSSDTKDYNQQLEIYKKLAGDVAEADAKLSEGKAKLATVQGRLNDITKQATLEHGYPELGRARAAEEEIRKNIDALQKRQQESYAGAAETKNPGVKLALTADAVRAAEEIKDAENDLAKAVEHRAHVQKDAEHVHGLPSDLKADLKNAQASLDGLQKRIQDISQTVHLHVQHEDLSAAEREAKRLKQALDALPGKQVSVANRRQEAGLSAADFSGSTAELDKVSQAALAAVAHLKALVQAQKEQEKELNRTSSAGQVFESTANRIAHAVANTILTYQKLGRETEKDLSTKGLDAAGRSLKESETRAQALSRAFKELFTDGSRMARSISAGLRTIAGAGGDIERGLRGADEKIGEVEAAFKRTEQAVKSFGNQFGKIGDKLASAGSKGFEFLNTGFRLPLAIIAPLIAGILGSITPLVALLGAAGGATLGFANSLSQLAGIAAAIPGLLSAIVGAAAAVKVGLGGITSGTSPFGGGVGVLSAYQSLQQAKATAATSGGGGSSGSQYPSNAVTASQKASTLESDRSTLQSDRYSIQDDAKAIRDNKLQIQSDKYTIADDRSTIASDVSQVQSDKSTVAADKQQIQQDAINIAQDKQSIQRDREDIAYAKTQLQRTYVDVARSIQDAEDNVAKAQQNALNAQLNLTTARKDALAQLVALNKEVQRAKEYQDAANASLQLAKENVANVLADPSSTLGQKEEAQAQLEAAQSNVQDVADQNKANKDQLDQINAAGGVESMPQVVAAKQQLADAQKAVADALLTLQRAREDGPRQILEAQRAVQDAEAKLVSDQMKQQADVRAAADDKRKLLDDERKITDDQRKIGEDQLKLVQDRNKLNDDEANTARVNQKLIDDRRKLLEDEKKYLADQKLPVKPDSTGSGSSGGSSPSALAAAQAAYAAALAKLAPAARSVVLDLIAMGPAWDAMRRRVQQALFAPLLPEMANLKSFIPTIGDILEPIASAVGTFFAKTIGFITSPEEVSQLKKIGSDSGTVLSNIGDGFLSLAKAWTDFTVAAGPFTKWLTGAIAHGLRDFSNTISQGAKDGSLKKWLDGVEKTIKTWYSIVKNVLDGLWGYIKAAGPLGTWLTDALEKWSENFAQGGKNAADGKGPFAKWINSDELKRVLSDTKKIFRDFFTWFEKEVESPVTMKALDDLLVSLDKLGKPLGKIFDDAAASGVGAKLVDLFTAIVNLIASIDPGVFQAFGNFMVILTNAINTLAAITNLPFVGPILAFILAVGGTAFLLALTPFGKLAFWVLQMSHVLVFPWIKPLMELLQLAGKGGITALLKLASLPLNKVAPNVPGVPLLNDVTEAAAASTARSATRLGIAARGAKNTVSRRRTVRKFNKTKDPVKKTELNDRIKAADRLGTSLSAEDEATRGVTLLDRILGRVGGSNPGVRLAETTPATQAAERLAEAKVPEPSWLSKLGDRLKFSKPDWLTHLKDESTIPKPTWFDSFEKGMKDLWSKDDGYVKLPEGPAMEAFAERLGTIGDRFKAVFADIKDFKLETPAWLKDFKLGDSFEWLKKFKLGDGFEWLKKFSLGDSFEWLKKFKLGDSFEWLKKFSLGDSFEWLKKFRLGDSFEWLRKFRLGDGFEWLKSFKLGDTFEWLRKFKLGDGFEWLKSFKLGDTFEWLKTFKLASAFDWLKNFSLREPLWAKKVLEALPGTVTATGDVGKGAEAGAEALKLGKGFNLAKYLGAGVANFFGDADKAFGPLLRNPMIKFLTKIFGKVFALFSAIDLVNEVIGKGGFGAGQTTDSKKLVDDLASGNFGKVVGAEFKLVLNALPAAFNDALDGLTIGAEVGGPWGALIGAIVGWLIGIVRSIWSALGGGAGIARLVNDGIKRFFGEGAMKGFDKGMAALSGVFDPKNWAHGGKQIGDFFAPAIRLVAGIFNAKSWANGWKQLSGIFDPKRWAAGAKQIGSFLAPVTNFLGSTIFNGKNWANGWKQLSGIFDPKRWAAGAKQIGSFLAPVTNFLGSTIFNGKNWAAGWKQLSGIFDPKNWATGAKQIGDFLTSTFPFLKGIFNAKNWATGWNQLAGIFDPKNWSNGAKQIGTFLAPVATYLKGLFDPKSWATGWRQITDFCYSIGTSISQILGGIITAFSWAIQTAQAWIKWASRIIAQFTGSQNPNTAGGGSGSRYPNSYLNKGGEVQYRNEGGEITDMAYFADGGDVPSSKMFKPRGEDTVPAMLTPGEFVMQKAVVRVLGAQALNSINQDPAKWRDVIRQATGLQRAADMHDRNRERFDAKHADAQHHPAMSFFANGGFVNSPGYDVAMSTPAAVPLMSTASSSTVHDRSITIESLEINNPVPERSTQSLSRQLRRMATFGSNG